MKRTVLLIMWMWALATFSYAGVPGTLDISFNGSGYSTFSSYGDANAFSYAVVVQPDGKVLVAGDGSNGANHDAIIIRYNPDGTLDDTFGTLGVVIYDQGLAGHEGARAIALQSDGKIVIAGYASSGALIARFDGSGRLDAAFGTGGVVISASMGYISSVVLQPDQKIVVAGQKWNGSDGDISVGRFNADGSVDTSFNGTGIFLFDNSGAADNAEGLAIRDGKIIVVGSTELSYIYDMIVLRLTDTGILDSSFNGSGIFTRGAGVENYGDAVTVLADSSILVAGRQACTAVCSYESVLFKLTASGSPDGTFGSGGLATFPDMEARSVAVDATGKILLGGYDNDYTNLRVLRYSGSGALDSAFGTAGSFIYPEATAEGLALQGSKVLATGYTFGLADIVTLRMDTDGTLDTTFGSGGSAVFAGAANVPDSYSGAAIQADGKIIVTGFSEASSNNDLLLMRFTVDGTRDASFNGSGIVLSSFNNGADEGKAVAIQPSDQKIVVVGSAFMESYGDILTARYNPDGSLDSAFGSGGFVTYSGPGYTNDTGYGVALQPGGEIVVVGEVYNGSNYDLALLRYDSSGNLDAAFNSAGVVTYNGVANNNDAGYAVALQANGRIVVAGYSDNGSDRDMVVLRYMADGTLDTTFGTNGVVVITYGSNHDEVAYALAVQPDQKILVAGSLSVGAKGREMTVIRLNTDGTFDDTFGNVTAGISAYGAAAFVDDWAYAVGLESDGKIIVAGKIRNGTSEDVAVIRLDSGGIIDPMFGTGGKFLLDGSGKLNDTAYAVAVQADDRVVVAGELYGVNRDAAVMRLFGGTPRISADPASIDFGNIVTGLSSPVETITVSNGGTADLSISSVLLDDWLGTGEFFLDAETCSGKILAPGESCVVDTRFAPLTTGSKGANIIIDSDDPDNSSAYVSLTGNGAQGYSLDVILGGAGSGTVTSTPAGIDCGSDCSGIYAAGTPVTLQATPSGNSRFVRWEGDMNSALASDQLTVDSDRSVTAIFAVDRNVCSTCPLQDAIDAAGIGDRIKLQQGTYHQNIVISSPKEITITGGYDESFTEPPVYDPSLTVLDGDSVLPYDGLGDGTTFAMTASGDVILENLTIMNGYTASGQGGGIALVPASGDATLGLWSVVIRNNAAESGGGIFALSADASQRVTVSAVNSFIVENAALFGGGIFVGADGTGDASLSLMNATVTNNRGGSVGAGAGLYAGETSGSGWTGVSITNSIVWGNRAVDSLNEDDIVKTGISSVAAAFSDIGVGAFTPGSGVISEDPVFVNPALINYRIHSDSPAVGTGTSLGAPLFDFEGDDRTAVAGYDMGADEYAAPLLPPSALKLLSLNGGEVIDAGMPYDIVWEAPATAQSFKVLYSLDNGLTWVKAKSADPAVTGNIVTGQEHFRWDVPVQTKNKKKSKIKVIGYTGPDGTGAKAGIDKSDAVFTLQAATLLRPNGGETLPYGQNYIIRWATTERPALGVTSAKLMYTVNGGLSWKTIDTVAGNPGYHDWTVPTLAKAKGKCRVKVLLYSGTTKVGADTSDAFFAIGP